MTALSVLRIVYVLEYRIKELEFKLSVAIQLPHPLAALKPSLMYDVS